MTTKLNESSFGGTIGPMVVVIISAPSTPTAGALCLVGGTRANASLIRLKACLICARIPRQPLSGQAAYEIINIIS
ncbi:hypothetical protein [Clavibacter michiganensis]|uniref:hypothetical protein n=1 Tax=Clavibacter michiganensis TaxID=28447 RepID=UPI000A98DBF3|nr:hypothetical protein [Clavibacter michiganensis]